MEILIKKLILWGILALFACVIFIVGRARVSPRALPLAHNGVHAPYNVRNARGELLFYNFRAVEPGRLYRGSGFVRNRSEMVAGQKKKRSAAFADSETYEFFRRHNIRTIVNLQELDNFYPEQGYFDYWNSRSGKKRNFHVKVVRMSVKNGHAYDKDAEKLSKYTDPDDRRFGLRAGAEFIALMKTRTLGAVYVHCDAGKDRTGVVCAAYELWRNQGKVPRDELWQQVKKRYLVSNLVIGRDKEAGAFAGGLQACGPGEPRGYVCGSWLDRLRPQLEMIAQLN